MRVQMLCVFSSIHRNRCAHAGVVYVGCSGCRGAVWGGAPERRGCVLSPNTTGRLRGRATPGLLPRHELTSGHHHQVNPSPTRALPCSCNGLLAAARRVLPRALAPTQRAPPAPCPCSVNLVLVWTAVGTQLVDAAMRQVCADVCVCARKK